jgi:beta-lactamase regulating signal transducer with metallopeptidase domain
MLDTLARASLEGAILVTVVWAATRLLPTLSPAARTLLWWCAAAKFVVALVWVAPVSLPILPAAPPSTIVRTAAPASSAPAIARKAIAPANVSPGGSSARLVWRDLAAGLWAVGVVAAAAAGWRRSKQAAAVKQCAQEAPAHVRRMTADLAGQLGVRREPAVLVSSAVQTPLVAGLRRPAILVPESFLALPERQQRMVLCHELAHVKRGDLWFGCAPALAERVFFFHPLAHLAAREYGLWREAACDATVMRTLDASPREYGRLLLDLGITRPRVGLAAAGASWSFSSLKRRIAMLREPSNRPLTSRLIGAGAVAVAAGAIVPLQLTARSPHPVTVIESAWSAPASVPAAVSPAPVAAPAGINTRDQAKDDEREKDRLNYVLLHEDHQSMSSGSSGDIRRARSYQRSGERLLWFRHEGREYVVRDPATLDEVENTWHPVGELGGEMGKIGAKQGEIGAKQGEVGARQGAVGAEQGRIGAQQGALGSRQAVLAAREMGQLSEAQRAEIEKERRNIDTQMRALDDEMQKLGRKMEEVSQPMMALGKEMEAYGREMEALGKKMDAESKKAERAMRELIERTVQSGTAQIAK